MKHLKKYSELEEINEISKELAYRAAKAARDKSKSISTHDDLGKDKISNQYELFNRKSLGEDIIEKIEKAGFEVDVYVDHVILSKDTDIVVEIYKDSYAILKEININLLSEAEKRKLIYLIKLIQNNLSKLDSNK
jgi:hypothetical protein